LEVLTTLPETKIAPENGWLEDEMSFWDGLFSGAIFSFREGKLFPVSSTIMQVENDHFLFQVLKMLLNDGSYPVQYIMM